MTPFSQGYSTPLKSLQHSYSLGSIGPRNVANIADALQYVVAAQDPKGGVFVAILWWAVWDSNPRHAD